MQWERGKNGRNWIKAAASHPYFSNFSSVTGTFLRGKSISGKANNEIIRCSTESISRHWAPAGDIPPLGFARTHTEHRTRTHTIALQNTQSVCTHTEHAPTVSPCELRYYLQREMARKGKKKDFLPAGAYRNPHKWNIFNNKKILSRRLKKKRVGIWRIYRLGLFLLLGAKTILGTPPAAWDAESNESRMREAEKRRRRKLQAPHSIQKKSTHAYSGGARFRHLFASRDFTHSSTCIDKGLTVPHTAKYCARPRPGRESEALVLLGSIDALR